MRAQDDPSDLKAQCWMTCARSAHRIRGPELRTFSEFSEKYMRSFIVLAARWQCTVICRSCLFGVLSLRLTLITVALLSLFQPNSDEPLLCHVLSCFAPKKNGPEYVPKTSVRCDHWPPKRPVPSGHRFTNRKFRSVERSERLPPALVPTPPPMEASGQQLVVRGADPSTLQV